MTDLAVGLLAIIGASLVIAGGAIGLVVFRPSVRHRRRHRRHSARPRIDLCTPPAEAGDKSAA